MVKVEDLIPHPRNPNVHTDAQIALLAKVIKHHGFRLPIIVSEKSGYIIAGHGRLEASKLLGMKEVPVDIQKFKSEAEENSHLIADNRLAELSDFDGQTLKDLIEELDTGENDLDLTGYTQYDLENLMSQFYQPEDPIALGDIEIKEECTLKVVCDNLQELEKIQSKLGITAKECSGKVMLAGLE
jgi:ParB-like chromosome segregation protein Spo0J